MPMPLLWDNSILFPLFFRNKWGLFVALIVVVIILSLIPQQSIPKVGFTNIDLLVHLVMYSALAYGLSLWLFDRIADSTLSIWIYPIFLGLFGLVIEVLQKTLPINRFFSWEDAASNLLGALSFFLWAYKIRR